MYEPMGSGREEGIAYCTRHLKPTNNMPTLCVTVRFVRQPRDLFSVVAIGVHVIPPSPPN